MFVTLTKKINYDSIRYDHFQLFIVKEKVKVVFFDDFVRRTQRSSHDYNRPVRGPSMIKVVEFR